MSLAAMLGACSFDTSVPVQANGSDGGFFSPDAQSGPDGGRSLNPDAANGADASTGDSGGILNSYSFSGELDLDGDLDDAWLAHPFINYKIDQAAQLMSIPGYAPDAELHFASLYDDDKIYFFLEVVDDLLITNSTNLFNDDSVEIYIDGLNDRSGVYGDDDHWLVIGESGSYQSLGPTALAVSGSIKNTAVGYNIEVSVDRSDLGGSASAPLLGFNVGLNDDDDMGDTGVDAYGLWHVPSAPSCSDCCTDEDGNFAWCDTTRLGQLELVP